MRNALPSEELVKKTDKPQALKELISILLSTGFLYFEIYTYSTSKRFAFFRFTEKRMLKKAKAMFERAVDIGEASNDDLINELGEKAKDILEKYF